MHKIVIQNNINKLFILILARTLTVMISTQDINLYIVYGVSIIQNLAVALVTYIYSSKKKKED